MAGWLCWLLIVVLLLWLVRQVLRRRRLRRFAATMRRVYVPKYREILNQPSALDVLMRHAKMHIGPADTVPAAGQVVIAEYSVHPYWFESLEGREWLKTPEGCSWLDSPEGREWSELQCVNWILDEVD